MFTAREQGYVNEVESISVRQVTCDDSNFSHSSAKPTAIWQVFSSRSGRWSAPLSRIDRLPWGVLRLSFPTIPRFALTVLAVLELARPALRQPPTKSHTFPQYRAPASQSDCPRTHGTPPSTSLPPPSTLTPVNQCFQVPYLSSRSSPRPLSYSSVSHFLFLSEWFGYRSMPILRHHRQFNPTLVWQRKLSGWPRGRVFTLVVWLEDKTMKDRYQTWGSGAFSLSLIVSTCGLCVSGF